MLAKVRYEIMIVLTEEFNDGELKTWSYNYGRKLKKLHGSRISVLSRGKRNLAYPIKNENRGNYVQIDCLGASKYINTFSNLLASDSHVLRFLILSKKI